MTLKRTIIESPYGTRPDGQRCSAREIARNERYLNRCIRDSLDRGNEAPYASHGFFTARGRLDDRVPEQRKLGIESGLAWGAAGQQFAVYGDHGVTSGMQQGIDRHRANGLVDIGVRIIGPEPIGMVYREAGAKLIVDVLSDATRGGQCQLVLTILDVICQAPGDRAARIGEEMKVGGRIGSEHYWGWRISEE